MYRNPGRPQASRATVDPGWEALGVVVGDGGSSNPATLDGLVGSHACGRAVEEDHLVLTFTRPIASEWHQELPRLVPDTGDAVGDDVVLLSFYHCPSCAQSFIHEYHETWSRILRR